MFALLIISFVVTACNSGSSSGGVNDNLPPSSAKQITAYSINNTPGVIIGENITVTLPYGADATNLTATFTTSGTSVTVDGVAQVSGVTPNNFTSPVTYTVQAADRSTQDYTVTVTVAAIDAKDITAFSINGTYGVITGQNIAVTLPSGTTSLTNLIATFITTGESVTVGNVTQVSGVTPNNFTSPVAYKVTAADGSTKNYTVTVTNAASNAKNITQFSINGTPGVINGQTIAVTLPSGTNLTSLIATFITTGASVTVGNVTQVSGVTPNNFTSPLTYKVTAADYSTQNYTVTVTAAGMVSTFLSIGSGNSYSYSTESYNSMNYFNRVISNVFGLNSSSSTQVIDLSGPYWTPDNKTNSTNIVPFFTLTSGNLYVNSIKQVSGNTVESFGNGPIVYSVAPSESSPYKTNYNVSYNLRGHFIYTYSSDNNLSGKNIVRHSLNYQGYQNDAESTIFVASTTGAVYDMVISYLGTNKYVYVSTDDGILKYQMNPTTGDLQYINIASATKFRKLIIDRTGNYLYAYDIVSGIRSFKIAQDGSLTALQIYSSGKGSSNLFFTFDPSGSYLYAVDQTGNQIWQYSMNALSGALTPLSSASVPISNGSNPQAVAVSGSYLFVTTWNGGAVNQYKIGSNGTLAANGSTVVTGTDNLSGIATGNFTTNNSVYVAVNNTRVILNFNIGTDGKLTYRNNQPTNWNPTDVKFNPFNQNNPNDTFGGAVYFTNNGVALLTSYNVNKTDVNHTLWAGASDKNTVNHPVGMVIW